MTRKRQLPGSAERGIVLISSLLLLLVVTIIALSMFRSFGMQEKIAGNMREKQRALQAAVSAQEYAEYWLSLGNSSNATVTCSGLVNANAGFGQICNQALSSVVPGGDVTVVPWVNGSNTPIGVSFTPTNMLVNTNPIYIAGNTNPTYWGTPTFYIADMGPSIDPTIPGEIYQIDAVGYGGGQTTAAVVESTYAVYTSSSNRTL
jgi:type IV pilus assembly protein PilX